MPSSCNLLYFFWSSCCHGFQELDGMVGLVNSRCIWKTASHWLDSLDCHCRQGIVRDDVDVRTQAVNFTGAQYSFQNVFFEAHTNLKCLHQNALSEIMCLHRLTPQGIWSLEKDLITDDLIELETFFLCASYLAMQCKMGWRDLILPVWLPLASLLSLFTLSAVMSRKDKTPQTKTRSVQDKYHHSSRRRSTTHVHIWTNQ